MFFFISFVCDFVFDLLHILSAQVNVLYWCCQVTRRWTRCTLWTVRVSQCSSRSLRLHAMRLATPSVWLLNLCMELFRPSQRSYHISLSFHKFP